jgi:hypothetical protein
VVGIYSDFRKEWRNLLYQETKILHGEKFWSLVIVFLIQLELPLISRISGGI